MAIIKKSLILEKFTKPTRTLQNAAKKEALIEFNEKRDELIKDLENHVVSKELSAGAGEDDNPSGILNGRSGNLRAFLGFRAGGYDPVDQIRRIFKEIRMPTTPISVTTNKKDRINYRFMVVYPTLKEIYSQTPYPSSEMEGSWLRGIHNGIPGLRYYLFSTEFPLSKWSRSGFAIQSKHIVKGSPGKSSGRKYVDELLENFKKKFK